MAPAEAPHAAEHAESLQRTPITRYCGDTNLMPTVKRTGNHIWHNDMADVDDAKSKNERIDSRRSRDNDQNLQMLDTYKV